jgi:hypothetical protein
MKKQIISFCIAFVAWMTMDGVPLYAQEEADSTNLKQEEEKRKPERPAFESSVLIDNQTVLVPKKGTLEFMLQHRFGTMANGITDLWGMWAPGNIRLGVAYTVFDKLGVGSLKGPLSIGIGTTKNSRIQDFNWKYGILQQTKGGGMPVSVTYYGVAGIETQAPVEDLPNGNSSDRISYFHQIIIARRFSSKLSVQVAPSISHYNVVSPNMTNDMISIAGGIRYKFSAQSAIILNVDQPLTKMTTNNPYPNFGFGIEVATSSHAFQFFASCFDAIVPQKNNMYNQNDPYGKGLRLGFNITRLWNF